MHRAVFSFFAVLASLTALVLAPDHASAQTMITGGNTGTTTWTLTGSPYIVTGDVTVQAGAVLTIEPGVVVRFRSGDSQASGVDTSRTELTVRGTLVVNGTAPSPVTFQADSGTAAGTWYGIVVDATATSATIANAVVQHAVTGLRTSAPGSALNLSGSSIRTCSTYGLQISAGTPTIDRVSVSSSATGIYVDGGTPTIANALVTASTSYGVRVTSSAGATTLDHATISGGSTCLYFQAALTLTGSIVTGCSSEGVRRTSTSVAYTGSYNDVWSNGTNYWTDGAATAPSPGTGSFSANPLYVGGGNYRITSNSPARLSDSLGNDMGALPYTGDATPGLYGTLWSSYTVPAGTTTVAGDLTVAPGVTLTLSPGATLSFATSDIMMAYSDTARAELRVQGTLSAVGASAMPITLTGAGSGAGAWYGVQIQASATGTVLDNVVIEEVVIGLRHQASAGQAIRRTTVRSASTYGFQISTAPAEIDAIVAQGNATGIYVDGGTPTITHALVTASTSYGVRITSSAGATTVDHATIAGGSTCVYFQAALTLTGSIVTGCSGEGVRRTSTSVAYTGSYNDVWSNGTNYWTDGAATAPSPGTGSFSANPLYAGGGNYRITSNSPARLSDSLGNDMGALPYTGDATPGLYGTLWSSYTVPAGTTTVAGDLTVAPGVTLTLSPGAMLSFATSDIMMAYSDTARAELRVFGTLTAVGASAMPITLTGAGSGAGAWYGVQIQPSATGTVLDNVVIDEVVIGVRHQATAGQRIVRTIVRSASTYGFQLSSAPDTFDAVTALSCATGIYVDGGAATIRNAVVASSTSYGVRLTSSASATTIENATISGGSTCIYFQAALTLRDSIVTGCSGEGVRRTSTSVAYTGSYNDVWSNGTNYWTDGAATAPSPGTGSISSNPQFVGAGDYHLTASSVCIDSGTTSGATADRDGIARPLDGDGVGGAAWDIGAYEFVRMLICGDGVVTAGEACDEGALNGTYGHCNATCSGLGPRCGDMVVNGPEACDDGNTSNTDACLNSCVAATCGDSYVRAGVEACDDGNTSNTDACLSTCVAATCGDSYVRTGVEQCDDGNTSSTDACLGTCVNAVCGDGFVRSGVEACDDGNTVNTDACLTSCQSATCGDGYLQTGVEACDDGNASNSDGCVGTCVAATCGDSYVRTGVEACDDGNTSNSDACVGMCVAAVCGDGYTQAGVEACDDANAIDTDACLSTCVAARCGDGIVGPGESCDDGNTVDGDACSNTCAAASCGDGVVQAGEQCDDGNGINDDACSNACQSARCGDSIRQSGEECDDGNSVDTDACTNACQSARCGDGIVASTEQCDDGNTIATDACTATCATAVCGDGIMRAGVEECDDGNASNTDGCVGACVAAACGDGYLRSGVEACDDGNTMDGDTCSAECALVSCGDGTVQAGEACDDGNASNLDGCLNTCLAASCGDGFRRTGVEACDDGNGDDTDACLATCRNASCGDGFVQAGVEACDDGNAEETDACRTTCESASCGDTYVQDGVETCDDGNDVPGDGCSASCTLESTADGGVPDADGGVPADDGGRDVDGGAVSVDGGIDGGTGTEAGGCGCRAAGAGPGSGGAALTALALLGLAIARRRRR